MSSPEFPENEILIPVFVLVSLIISLYLLFYRNSSTSIPTNWPFLGMIPGLVRNSHRIHEYITDILKETGGTLVIKSPWFSKTDTLATSDPANVHYILSKNFVNYPKGPTFRKIFDILGDGIFNTDGELWELQRRTTTSLFHHPEFHNLLQTTLWNKVEKGLLPLLESKSQGKGDQILDLQDVFQRFTFDTICKMALDFDPESLSVDLPYLACEKAFVKAEEALFYRYIIPKRYWRWQVRLRIGLEKDFSDGQKVLDQFMYKCISAVKQQEEEQEQLITTMNMEAKAQGEKEEYDLCTAFMRAYKEQGGTSGDPKKFLRDTLLNLVVAGKDTTSTALTWFFYLLAKNPLANDKILEEIYANVNSDVKDQAGDDQKYYWKVFSEKAELRKLVYLHGALSEALRLYPPVALQHKSPTVDDVLPSGHRIKKHTKIILSFYSMARMEIIWGKDCLEFKPERWISEKGGIKQIPSFKFPAFHGGPRSCLGKEMSFIEMKIIAITIICNYHVELVEGHPVIPSDSVVLQMKHGLMVKLTKRNNPS